MAMGTTTTKHTDSAGQTVVANLIGGEPVVLPASASFPVICARTGRTVHHGQTVTAEIAKQAVDVAAATFKTYKRTSAADRRRWLGRAAELFEAKAHEVAELQMSETSCDDSWAKFTSTQTSTFCRSVAGALGAALVGDIQPSAFGYTHLVFKEPVGPVMLIPPWNAAVVLAVRGIANALAAGCTVVVKASELCPATHQFIVKVFHEAGFPAGAVNMITADRPAAAAISEAVIGHPALRKIEFIGSAAVGKAIGALAAKHLKPVFMELGDQSPAIVLDDADLTKAASIIARGAMFHHGQVCFSTERILVHSSVSDAFLEELKAALDELAPHWIAVTQDHAKRAKAVVDDAVAKGAKIVIGASEMVSAAQLSPVILSAVAPGSIMYDQECFGPAASYATYETDLEAIEEANSRPGGLSAAVFTRNMERGLRIARDLEFGMVQLNNSTIFAEPDGPATNFKGSGWGSNNGRYGIENFLYSKAVSLVPTFN